MVQRAMNAWRKGKPASISYLHSFHWPWLLRFWPRHALEAVSLLVYFPFSYYQMLWKNGKTMLSKAEAKLIWFEVRSAYRLKMNADLPALHLYFLHLSRPAKGSFPPIHWLSCHTDSKGSDVDAASLFHVFKARLSSYGTRYVLLSIHSPLFT